jgi:hypothetical protein
MPVRRILALLLALGTAAPAAAAEAPPRQLFVIGDSLAYDNAPYLQRELPRWKIESDTSFARSARDTAHDLRKRSHAHPPLPPVIHVSTGTGDDPSRYQAFERSVQLIMRIAGPHRCVVWANVWRLSLAGHIFAPTNYVLAAEDAARPNLRVVDWYDMVEAHPHWLVDPVHVNAAGNRARAAAVSHDVNLCRNSLKS